MERDNLKELSRLAESKGFMASTLTTSWAENYLLGMGKDFYLNDMCFYLWLCELKKWLGDSHNIYLEICSYHCLEYKKEKPFGVNIDYKKNGMWDYSDLNEQNFKTQEEALEYGCYESLKIIE